MKERKGTLVLHRFPARPVLLLFTLVAAGFATPSSHAAERPPDADITYWIQEALRGDSLVDSAAIHASTKDGVVTLTGSVRSLSARTAATQEVKKIRGVVAVLDKLTTDPAWRPDTDIAQDVRRRILNSAVIRGHDIRVESQTGEVTLEGRVGSWVESREAQLLAAETRGVREVRNRLIVNHRFSRDDREIKNDAVAALDLDVYLRGLPITVTVDGGTVTLTGTVGNHYEKDRAGDAIRWISNVSGVNNELEVDWIPGDRSRGETPVVTDDQLQKNVSAQIERDRRVDASGIAVTAFAGDVTLRGSVPFGSQKRIATQDARDTVGVVRVTDELHVVTPPRDDGAIRSDELFEMAVDEALAGQDIDVSVEDGVVTLSGTVHTWFEKTHARTVAWRPRGVLGVLNHLEVARDPKYSDEQLREKIESRLKWNWTTFWVHKAVDVNVKDGVAVLQGHVDTWSERAEAGRLAAHTAGVWRVQNRLRVGDYPYSRDEGEDTHYDDDLPYGP